VEYQIYNLIEQKIEQLVGDYFDRPALRKAYVLNKGAQIRKLNAKIEMMAEGIFRELNKEFQEKTGVALETENPEMEIPEDVEIFFQKDYRDSAEAVADSLIEKFLDVDRQKSLLPETIKDFLISDEAHLKIIDDNGTVKWVKGHPLEVDCDLDPAKVVQDDHEMYVDTNWMTENEIYNNWNLTKEQKSAIKQNFLLLQNLSSGGNINKFDQNSELIGNKNWYVSDNKSFRLCIVHMVWKSRKQIRTKVVTKENGNKNYVLLNDKDNERTRENEKIIKANPEVGRFCIMIGPDVCLDYGIEPHRNYHVSNKKKCYLDVVSIKRQNTIGSGQIRSVAAKLYKMQYWASEILFELRAAMRRNKGKVMMYDVSQTPKQYLKGGGNPLNRVMHHMTKDQMVFFNSKEKNNRYGFNQFTAVDLSNQHHIKNLIEGLMLVEDMSDRMVGLTPGRQGQAGQHTTATNVDSQRKASFSKTENYYRPFDDFVRVCLERVLMKSKNVYKKNEFIHYVIGDLEQKFLQIMPEFFDSDIGIYFNDSGKDQRKKQVIDQAAEAALQNAQTPQMMKALVDILCEDTAVESMSILDNAVQSMEKMEQQRMAAEQEANQAAAQQKQFEREEDNALIKRGQDKDIVVAGIYADQKSDQVKNTTQSNELIKLADIEAKALEKTNP